ncbi:Signal transduction histidine kinase [Ignavibacterium album JCM 16511]|uniref:histidine kinase n=1 Tax=Ignavibacterium album (strain DSM 19864 / JCM 16511 / NBRC 101810 / Mat9-16) TaxID=945713 RepID=I0ANG7_IGNAJ|nr:ATP-binding protein [Ignavibacterium album]AFH50524.1 Signal transduction histidine kinase [Ignavibacterium album JCM 16511]
MTELKFKLPLFWKFSLAIITIVLTFGSINSILIYNNVQTALQAETEKRALFIARSIANQITSSILFEDYISLQNIISSIKEIDENIYYIFISDNKNNVLVHTFSTDFPSELINANTIKGNQSFNTQLLLLKDLNNEIILDVAVPILDGKVGLVRVGLKETSIIADVQKTVNIFWLMVAAFLTVGIIGALIFAKFITKPIKAIQSVAENIELNQIGKQEIPQIKIREKFLNRIKMLFRAEDEIDILADKFNQMILRLDNAYRDLQNAQSTIIQSEKLATVGTLTAGLAHEINNPIAGLQNCIRRIQNDPSNVEQNIKYINMMETAVDKIEKVVGNLLNFTRKQSGDFISLSINEIVENSLLLVSHRLEKLRISITNYLSADLPKIKGNKNQLEQVFLNLLINAIDSIEEKNQVNPDCEKRIILSARRESDFLKIQIQDTGKGIPKNLLEKIFDPFFTTKSPGKGTGLGLSVVYNIIETHNGKIYFESEEGKGITVNLLLPIYK